MGIDLNFVLQSSSSSSSAHKKPSKPSSSKVMKKCYICKAKVGDGKAMWIHVGKHILKGSGKSRYPCGYYGRDCCKLRLGKPTKKNGELFYNIVEGVCPYKFDPSRKVKMSSRKHPCTNYLQKCTLCQADIWKYNLAHHYKDVHIGMDVPILDPTEIHNMNKCK